MKVRLWIFVMFFGWCLGIQNAQADTTTDFWYEGVKYYLYSSGTATKAAVTYPNNDGVHSYSTYGAYSGDITIPEKVTYNYTTYEVGWIGSHAFAGSSSNLKSITLPYTITTFDSYCFKDCTALTKVNIPKNCTYIADNAFEGCTSLEYIWVSNENTSFMSDTGVLYDKDQTTLIKCPAQTHKGPYFTTPSSTKKIEINAFRGNETLKKITISENVETIGQNAFTDTNPYIIYFNARNCKLGCDGNGYWSITTSNHGSFYNCHLYQLFIGDETETIQGVGFNTCDNLTSVWIGSNVTTLSKVFNNINVRKLVCLPSTKPLDLPSFSVGYAPSSSYGSSFTILPNLNTYFWDKGVAYVVDSFADRTCMTIDCNYYDFYPDITIGETLSYNDIDFQITSINNSIFYGNTILKNLTIKGGCKIKDQIATDCKKLEKVEIDVTAKIGRECFLNCTNLTVASINGKELGTSIFSNCNSLEECQVGDDVTSISYSFFKDCKKLKSIEIGSNIQSIDKDAFLGCSDLASFSITTITPPSCSDGALSGIDKWNCTLYVPAQSVDLYKKANGWKEFLYIEGIESDEPTAISLLSSLTLKYGATARLTPEIEPENAVTDILWSSSKEAVATVSDEGLVTAVGEGNATITAETTVGGLTAICKVTVTPKPLYFVTELNGGALIVMEMTNEPKVLHEGEWLTIEDETVTYSYIASEVHKFYMDWVNEGNSASDALADRFNGSIKLSQGEILLQGFAPNTEVCVYSLSGILMDRQTIPAEGSLSIQTIAYAPGTYIVKADNNTLKFIKK